MRLYDNDAYREEFMALVYELLMSDETNDRANQIISAFDMAPEVEAEPLKPNDPLTPEELREMGGEPVYVTGTFTDCRGERPGAWALVDVKQKMCRVHGGGLAIFENCGKYWLAYRRKPEEGTA